MPTQGTHFCSVFRAAQLKGCCIPRLWLLCVEVFFIDHLHQNRVCSFHQNSKVARKRRVKERSGKPPSRRGRGKMMPTASCTASRGFLPQGAAGLSVLHCAPMSIPVCLLPGCWILDLGNATWPSSSGTQSLHPDRPTPPDQCTEHKMLSSVLHSTELCSKPSSDLFPTYSGLLACPR